MKLGQTLRSFFDWLLGRPAAPQSRETSSPQPTGPPSFSPARPDHRAQAEVYLSRVRAKLEKLAEDFNSGTINRAQFQNLYAHYQREIRNIETIIEATPASGTWKGAITEGESMLIRRKHVAQAQGYAIYVNHTGMPLSTLGEFELDPALLVPMLSSYRAATREIFGAGMRSTAIEGGRWLCFVPGEFTTMMAIFSTEPASKQLAFLEELHRLFERANRSQLSARTIERVKLVFPHEYFLGQWRR